MCLASQWCALFRYLNFQKWSENGLFCTFWFGNCLNVVQRWCALYLLTRICASRRNSVQLFISHLAGWLRARRLSEPTFWPSGATNHWTNAMFRDLATFLRTCVPFLLCFFFLTFFSASSHPCFSCVQIGSLTSKLLNFFWLTSTLKSFKFIPKGSDPSFLDRYKNWRFAKEVQNE